MAIKKILASQLFDGYKFCNPNSVLIIKNEQVDSIIPLEEAGDDVLQIDGIVSPGFTNTHCHLELSHMQGLIPHQTAKLYKRI